MKTGFRQSMAWLHTWSGLLAGWILFAVFLTGTASYFRPEITAWMRPEAYRAGPPPASAQPMVDALARMAPGGFTLMLPDGRDGMASAYWREAGAGRRGFREAVLDPATGKVVQGRETRGGEFFFRLHFQLHYMSPLWGRWIVSFCAMMMLVAIISGIVTHKRIFADFFTFRPRKGQRSWIDAHAAVATLALPYHAMITFTGLVTLMLMLMPWGTQLAYPGDARGFSNEVFGRAAPARPSGRAAPLVAVDPLLAEASRIWGGAPASRITVSLPGDAAARVELLRGPAGRLSYQRDALVFDGATGAPIAREGMTGGAAATHGTMYGLHLGRFAGPALRALFFLSALAGTAMVGTGLILWAVKERQAAAKAGRAGLGLRLVEVLNLATVAGLPAAMAAFFWLNRLLPAGMAGRAEWEVNGFFLAWGALLLHATLRLGGRRGWVEQLALGGLLGLGLPVLNALTGPWHLGVTLPAAEWRLAGLDLVVAALGALLAGAALHLARRSGQPARKPRGAAPAGGPSERRGMGPVAGHGQAAE
ncbi:PepSY-associated TM helix domain-containing protein [Pararoseomonas sp. SCSIO 73927]|uniref:PepSY-associated TM helix domain-containing protein n=1 Tax=Pararoseomonas sp. SCSIO 73927 TaxID=3114537 RepID=UPI0030D05165